MPDSSIRRTLCRLIGAQQDELGRLLEFLALRVDVGDADGALAVESRLTFSTSHSVRSSKLGLRISTGRIVVCGLALE